MKRRHFIYFAVTISLLGAAWFVTRSQSAPALAKELQARSSQKGFEVSVEKVTCWFPLLFQASWDYQVPNTESGSAKGWYVLTPWKVYIIQQETTASL